MRPPDLSDSISAYADAARAAGAVELCSGAWSADAPQFVRAALRGHLRGGEAGYPPLEGTAQLREAISAHYGGAPVAAHHVTIAPGATGGMLLALSALVPAKSDLVLPEPGYPLTATLAATIGLGVRRVPAWFPVPAGGGWRTDVDRIVAALDESVSAVIVTDPDNPMGGVLTEDDWTNLIAGARRAGCRVIADRVYEHYPLNASPVPTPTLLAEGVVVIASISKWLHAAGLRVGWVLSDTCSAQALARASAILSGGVATPVQIAVANAIAAAPADYLRREAAAARRLERGLAAALAANGLEAWPADAGLFLNLPAAALGVTDSVAAWRALLDMGIGGVPSLAFRSSAETESEAFVRLSFARDAETLSRIPRRSTSCGGPGVAARSRRGTARPAPSTTWRTA